jgi:hypothetical protein
LPGAARRRFARRGVSANQFRPLTPPSPAYRRQPIRAAAADFIIRAVSDHPPHRAIIRQLMDALEICHKSEKLTWEAEHDAEIALAHAKSRKARVAAAVNCSFDFAGRPA